MLAAKTLCGRAGTPKNQAEATHGTSRRLLLIGIVLLSDGPTTPIHTEGGKSGTSKQNGRSGRTALTVTEEDRTEARVTPRLENAIRIRTHEAGEQAI